MTDAYRAAQLAARALEGTLDRETAARIAKALRDYANGLETGWVRDLNRLPTAEQRVTAVRSIRRLRDLADQLERDLAGAITTGQRVALERTVELWRRASVEAWPSGLVVPADGHLPLVVAQAAVDSAQHLKTLLTDRVELARREVQWILTEGLAEGVSPVVLARRLRPYVQGADKFPDRLIFGPDGRQTIDLRNAPPAFRGAARQLRYNTERIAFSEIHNARVAAELAAFRADPLIEAVRWTLAPDRGAVKAPDVCDVLATTDFYGLGAGIFPIERTPLSPHPFDRCERVPVLRPVSQANDPKPTGRLIVQPETVGLPSAGLTPKGQARLRAEVVMAIREVAA